ncbi:MAG: DNA-processing protein DprA [Chthonomonadales bacterium]
MLELDTMSLLLILGEIPGMGRTGIGQFLHHHRITGRTNAEIFRLDQLTLCKEYRLSETQSERILAVTPELIASASKAANGLQGAGVGLLTSADLLYPARLTTCMSDPPPFLFVYGNLNVLSQPTMMAANSNNAPEQALFAADDAVANRVQDHRTLITGHNRMPYQRPALAAMRNGGQICFVLDRGIVEAFGDDLSRNLFTLANIWSPKFNLVDNLVISPFLPREHGINRNNQIRDEIIFALADEILVGSIRPGGVMEKLSKQAEIHGKSITSISPNTR